MLNIKQLRAFYAAAMTQSITKAAEMLTVTPAAVTSQIKRMEEDTGVKLLIRAGIAMQLTEAGAAIFNKVKTIFEEIENVEKYIHDFAEGLPGTLRIGCTETAAVYVLPKAVKAFKNAYPDITAIVNWGPNEEMVQSLLEHKNEVLIIRFRPDDKRFKMEYIGKMEIILFSASDSTLLMENEIRLSELETVPIIVPVKGSATRAIVDDCLTQSHLSPKVMLECSSIPLVIKLVKDDEGVSFLCRDVVDDELSRNTLKEIRINDCRLFIEYGVAYLNSIHLSRPAQAFLKMIKECKGGLFE